MITTPSRASSGTRWECGCGALLGHAWPGWVVTLAGSIIYSGWEPCKKCGKWKQFHFNPEAELLDPNDLPPFVQAHLRRQREIRALLEAPIIAEEKDHA